MNQLPSFSVVLRRALPHGQCVVVTLPDPEDGSPIHAEARDQLAPPEVDFMNTLAPARRASFAGGRIALRLAAADLGLSAADLPPILKDARGAPTLPEHITGSISHKRQLAVGLLQPRTAGPGSSAGQTARVGVDIEILETRVIDIGPRVLTAAEREGIARLPDLTRRLQTLCAFSLKEALYKAAAPFVGRVIGFLEAEMTLPLPLPAPGTALETADLPAVPLTLHTPEARLDCEGAMFFWANRVISTCRAKPIVTMA